MPPAASEEVRKRCVERFRERGIKLPTFAQLADPSTIPDEIKKELENVGPDEAHPLNLFRIHWYNTADRKGILDVPFHIVLPESLTGVKAPIIVCFGYRFPMITAHKVLAAYGCLAPRLVMASLIRQGTRRFGLPRATIVVEVWLSVRSWAAVGLQSFQST